MIQNRFIYNNIRSGTHGCGSSRIEKKHSIQELSIACSLYIREHPAYESAPTSTHNVSLKLCATDNPNLAEFRYSSAKEGQGANRGAGSARTGVVHDLSLNDAKPPVKMQLSIHHNSLKTYHSVLSGGEGRHLKFSKQGADVYSSTQQNTKRPRSSIAPQT